MTHPIHFPPRTEHASVPPGATADSRITGIEVDEILLEFDMVGVEGRRLVLGLSGTVAEVRGDLDALRSALVRADALLEECEDHARYDLGGF